MFSRFAIMLVVTCTVPRLFAADYSLPERVRVLPIAFVPTDQTAPTDLEQTLFLRHIRWTQDRYRELLAGDTFELAAPKVKTVAGKRPLDFYRNQPEGGAPDIVAELLTELRVTRFNCPFVLCIMLMNARDGFPAGGGRSLNGGINTGSGMLYIASWELTHNTHFQCTLQHELGHAFGLPHVDVYGYDMQSNASIMSYNPAHHNRLFEPSPTPGVLIPEDRRALALNDRVFAKATFDPARDVPKNYRLASRIVTLGPMNLPGQPSFYPQVTTTAGEDASSKVVNIVQTEIKPSSGPGVTYDPATMWHSKPLPDGHAVLELAFPVPVRLSGLAIHSQHSGQYHEARAMKLETHDGDARQVITDQSLKLTDETVTFDPVTATRWSLTLTAGSSQMLVVRGLRFFDRAEEIFPHMVPYRGTSKGTVVDLRETPTSTPLPAATAVQQAATSAAGGDKAAVPDAATQDKIRKSIKEQFKADFSKAKKPDAKSGLARTLIAQAETADEDAMRHGLLTEAVSQAAQAGDFELALQATQAMIEKFDVNPLHLKERAAAAMGSATLTIGLEEAGPLLNKFVALADEAAQADEYVIAVNIMKSAADTLKKPAYKALKDDAAFLIKQLTSHREAFDAVRMSRDKLLTTPDDGAANLTWGRFVCCYKHEWETGLKLLAKSGDKLWGSLAQRELDPPTTAGDWLQLGDDWLLAGNKEKEPVRIATAERAERAWQQAVGAATQLQKKEIEQKVDARIVKLFGATFAVSRGDASGAPIPGSDRFTPTDPFTIEFWVSTTSEKGTLLSKKHTADESSVIVHLDGGIPNLSQAYGGGESGGGGGLPIHDGKWHHIAVVKQGDELTLYVDGSQAARTAQRAPFNSRSPWKFGCSYNRAACAARYGGLRISKGAIYQDAFTPRRVASKDKDTLFPQ